MNSKPPPDDKNVVPFAFDKTNGRKQKLNTIDTDALMKIEYDPIKWVVPNYVPEGFTVFAGRQKLGKTWMAIDWAIAVATGGFAMGKVECEPGDVLYIDLENGPRRIQRRIEAIFPIQMNRPNLSKLNWQTEAPTLDRGFIDMIEEWRLKSNDPRLIVIDVLQRIKPPGKRGRNAYENDYSIFADLQKWAMTHGIAVVGLHHLRKGAADDPLEALSGSNGLSAVADTTLVLNRDANGMTLYVRGRDVEEKESAVRFTKGIWDLVGDAFTVRMSEERQSIVTAMVTERVTVDAPVTPTHVAEVTGMKKDNVKKIMADMAKAGELQRVTIGKYALPDTMDMP